MSTIQNFGKGALRTAKNYTKGYSDTQAKVREATSNDPWGPSGTQMNELAQMSYNQNDFVEIMEMLDKRLNDKGKNWRHVFKALTVLDYLLHAGSENVVVYFRDNVYIIKTLKEFQYVDEFQKDQGANVRQKAKDITNLLQDEARLRQERKSRATMRDRMVGERNEDEMPRRSRSVPPASSSSRRPPRDDDEMRRALEESKRSLQGEEERSRRQKAEESDIEKAIRLSQEEEAARKRALEDANARSLFDEQNQLLVDPSMQPQHTSIQPQFTSFNPYTLQMQQQQMQDEYAQQQAQWQLMQQQQQQQQAQQQDEWQRQQLAQQQAQMQEEWNRQQQAQQQQQQQQMYQQQLAQQQPLQAQPTGFGSKNPFAFNQGPVASPPPMPAISQNNYASNNFASSSTPDLGRRSPATSGEGPDQSTAANTRANARRPYDDGENARLAALIGNREDGLDTFGNIGKLRYGNTGATAAPALVGQRTGQNPFAALQQRQQQTGAPQQPAEQPFFSI